MGNPILIENSPIEQAYLTENIYHSLQIIQTQLEKEILSKQKTIERQEQEIQKLRAELDERKNQVNEVNTRLINCQKSAEGNRQLINKLLNDIERLQQAIEWYKRTYESRSLLGVIKDKMKHILLKK